MKTRFCPSPTGGLHIGNMRTALFNYLFAKNKKGTFLLRIEDTDLSRSKDEYIQSIQDDLMSLNIDWDEGVSKGEQSNNYKQSERVDIYTKYYDNLLKNKQAYYCFCSEEELKVSRKVQASQGLPPKYNGKCRELSSEEISKNIASGKPYAVRFLVPRNITIEFEDAIRGKQIFDSNTIGDFIIRKADGMASFMFANAIDDSLMGVTHVLRGEDHLTNTPRQLLVLDALGLQKANYVHMSIIIGKDKQPLSKRNGSQSIHNLLSLGYLPIAVVNYLARIGHTYKNNNLLTIDELVNDFSIERLVKSPAIFDIEQLNAWQKLAVLNCSNDYFDNKFLNDININIQSVKKPKLITTLKNNILLPVDVDDWLNIFFSDALVYTDEHIEIIKRPGKQFFSIWMSLLNDGNISVKDLYSRINSELGVKGKEIYMPIRLLLTNKKSGAELQNIIDIIDINLIKKRIEVIIKQI